MFISKDDYEYLYKSLKSKYGLYDFIDDNYILNMLDTLKETGKFETIDIVTGCPEGSNPLFYFSFKIQNYLYYLICKKSEDDVDVLLSLVEDKRRVANLVLKKMNNDDFSKVDDYIMEIALIYNGEESFDSFITRYIMSVIKGVSFEVTKIQVTPKVEVNEEIVKKNKKSKKKKNKGIKDGFDIKVIRSNETPTRNDEASELETNICDESKIQELSVIPEVLTESEYKEPTLYEFVLDVCSRIKGSGIRDSFIDMILSSDLINKIDMLDNQNYKIYFLLRYGLLNDSFYTIEEISSIMKLCISDVLLFERHTIKLLRDYMNRTFDFYQEHMLVK